MFCTSKGKTVLIPCSHTTHKEDRLSLSLGEKCEYHIHFYIPEIYSAQIDPLLSFYPNCLCF